LVLTRVRSSIRTTLRQVGFEQRLGPENFRHRTRDAVANFTG
jgi:hypothetical protein